MVAVDRAEYAVGMSRKIDHDATPNTGPVHKRAPLNWSLVRREGGQPQTRGTFGKSYDVIRRLLSLPASAEHGDDSC